jgi:hypothetical protein
VSRLRHRELSQSPHHSPGLKRPKKQSSIGTNEKLKRAAQFDPLRVRIVVRVFLFRVNLFFP